MRPLRETLSQLKQNYKPTVTNLNEKNLLPLPDDSQCPTCQRFKPSYLDQVEMALHARGQPVDHLMQDIRLMCQCVQETEARRTVLQHRANLPARPGGDRLFTNFERTPETQLGFHAAWVFSQGIGPPILTLYGAVGSGKTHLLEAIGRQLLSQGQGVRYEYTPDLLNNIRRSYQRLDAQDNQPDPLAPAQSAHLLMLDDLGVEKQSDWTTEVLTRLVDARYRMGRRLAVATNKSRQDFEARGDSRLGDRLFDANSGLVNPVVLTTRSYRTK